MGASYGSFRATQLGVRGALLLSADFFTGLLAVCRLDLGPGSERSGEVWPIGAEEHRLQVPIPPSAY